MTIPNHMVSAHVVLCTKSQAHEVRVPCNIQRKTNSSKWVECTFFLQILMKIALKNAFNLT